MAMRGGLISHHKGKGNGNRNRGRSYGLMLLLAFGAALLGVMALHKLRERRIFNLLVDDKNRQLLSIQLLLQKEKEYTKEMKRRAEETKAKIYSLRNQKMELDRRVLEMQSTIDSLKDERKTMESEPEEKKKEINLLRDDLGNENPQVIALKATLKQKEAEIEDLKHHLKSSVRVWSVSTDDPSNPPVNTTIMKSMEQKDKTEFSLEEGGRVHESSSKVCDNYSTKGQDGNETKSSSYLKENKREGVEDGGELKMDMSRGQVQKLESFGEDARNEETTREMKNEYSKHNGTFKIEGEKNDANATDTIKDVDEQEKKSSFTAGQLGKLKIPHQEGESQKLKPTHKGEKKMEIDENSIISRMPGRFGHLSRTKGKRWRALARNRFLKKNVNFIIDGGESMSGRRFSKDYKHVLRSREEGKAEREETEAGLREEIDHTKANLFKHQNSEETEDMKHRKMSETNHQVEGENAKTKNHDNSLTRVVTENTGVNGEVSDHPHNAKQLKDVVVASSRDIKELEKKAQLNSADTDETEEHMKVADKQEPKTEAANSDLSSDFTSDSEDKEGYKEETDESEF
ncbi:hypothetical protein PTKIN_Ptkin02bG0120700 [Pterospermum kingtungense]